MAAPVLDMRGIVKVHGRNPVLRGIDVAVERHRVVFLEGGLVVEEGPPGQVLDDPQHPETREFLSRVMR